MKPTNTLIIIPTYNECQNAPRLIEELLPLVATADLLLVDDNSSDGTADLVEQRFAEEPRVRVMRRTGLRGLGRSYVDGYQYALSMNYPYAVQMDADFSHDPAQVPLLLEAALAVDVIVASRYCPGGEISGWPMHRQWLSRFSNFYVRTLLNLPVHDSTSGFRCYSRNALLHISLPDILSNGYAFQIEMTHRSKQAALSVREVPTRFTDRCQGHSKMSLSIILEAMLLPWQLILGKTRQRTFDTTAHPIAGESVEEGTLPR